MELQPQTTNTLKRYFQRQVSWEDHIGAFLIQYTSIFSSVNGDCALWTGFDGTDAQVPPNVTSQSESVSSDSLVSQHTQLSHSGYVLYKGVTRLGGMAAFGKYQSMNS